MKQNENFVIDLIGFLLFALGISAITNSLFIKNPYQIFWGCYLGLIILGIGIVRRNSFLIMSQIYILAIPLLIWDIDFIYYLILGKPLLGITDYFFIESSLNLSKIISLQHLFSIPLAVYALKKIGIKKGEDAWKMSFAQIILIFLVILFITPPEQNINCVFAMCGDTNFSGFFYRITWFVTFFAFILLTKFSIGKLLKNGKPKKNLE